MTQHLPQVPGSCFSDLRFLTSSRFDIYQAYDPTLEQNVILKVFPLTTSLEPKYQQEKSHLLVLNHPNVVRLIQAVDMAPIPNFSEEPTSYLVLEHATYGDLFKVVEAYGRMPEELARTLFHQLVEGLSYLHSQNIAHLDIKMENLLLDEDYKVKLADFDQSQKLDSSKLQFGGTFGYRAPEVREGKCQNFQAADIYSLGVILFMLVAGRNPYTEKENGIGPSFDRLYKLLKTKNSKFWEYHEVFAGEKGLFNDEFRQLIYSLMDEDPEKRLSIEKIKESTWYQNNILLEEEYREKMKAYMRQI